jgi:hypothetical protein
MRDADGHIKKILAAYDEDFASQTWLVPGGKSRAILHHCTERMAARAGVKFGPPQIVSASLDNVVIIVTASMGERSEWSFGEASPKNNRNAYPFSMAEKRAKGRVALKLIGLHGLLHDETETFVDDALPNGAEPTVPVKSSRQAKKSGDWERIESGIHACEDSAALLSWASAGTTQHLLRTLSAAWQEQAQEAWGKALADKIADECQTPSQTKDWGVEYRTGLEALPPEWLSTARHVCTEQLRALRKPQPEEVMDDV